MFGWFVSTFSCVHWTHYWEINQSKKKKIKKIKATTTTNGSHKLINSISIPHKFSRNWYIIMALTLLIIFGPFARVECALQWRMGDTIMIALHTQVHCTWLACCTLLYSCINFWRSRSVWYSTQLAHTPYFMHEIYLMKIKIDHFITPHT